MRHPDVLKREQQLQQQQQQLRQRSVLLLQDGREDGLDGREDGLQQRLGLRLGTVHTDVEALLEVVVALLDDGAILCPLAGLGAVVLQVLVVVDRVDSVVLGKAPKKNGWVPLCRLFTFSNFDFFQV